MPPPGLTVSRGTAVSHQLAAWGDSPEHEPKPRTERLERDLERVIDELAEDFPLLRSLVDRRAGGQKRLPMPGRGNEQVPGSLFAEDAGRKDESGGPDVVREGPPEGKPAQPGQDESAAPHGDEPEGDAQTDREGQPPEPAVPPSSTDATGAGATSAPVGTLSTVSGRRRPARYGLLVQFESRPDELELGRLVDSTIWINDAHPAYLRAAASRSTGYHLALSVALALAPLAVEASGEHAFVAQFLAQWGASPTQRGPRKRTRRR